MTIDNKDDFFDRALLKLKRKYGKDELVSSLVKQVQGKDLEIGKLKSEIYFLNDELRSKRELKEINKEANIRLRMDEMYQLKSEECKIHLKKISEIRKANNDLIIRMNKINQK